MKSKDAFRMLKQDGWYEVSQKGSHVKMRHPSKKGEIIFPLHGSKEIGTGLWSKLKKIAGL